VVLSEPVIRVCRYISDTGSGVGVVDEAGGVRPVAVPSVAAALRAARSGTLTAGDPVPDARLTAPLDAQEVWGAGVTYLRSRDARIDEATSTAAALYAQVYDAPRAELFFKATPGRVVGPGEPVVVRHDSHDTVPEPELALWLDSDLSLLGIGLGDDVTARDLEAENPLYLPQAKIWQGSCALGPWVLAWSTAVPLDSLEISMEINREGQVLFSGRVPLSRMHRQIDQLIEQLGHNNLFPEGVILLTGTGIVPPAHLGLHAGDEVCIEGLYRGEPGYLGQLRNPVVQGGAQ